MVSRERGIAHVNIFWALVPMVLFLGGVGYGYIKHTEADQAKAEYLSAKKERDEANARLAERINQLKAISEVVGNRGEFKATNPDIPPTSEFTTPTKLASTLEVFKGAFGIPGSLKSLNEILNAAKNKLSSVQDQVASLESTLNNTRAERDQINETLASVRSAKDEEISRLQDEKRQVERNLDQTQRNLQAQLADQRSKVQRARDERRSIEEASSKKLAAKERELQAMSAHVQTMADRIKLINSPGAPDGRILESSEMTGLAWIDRGAQDLVKSGMVFRVVEPGKDGGSIKAYAIVVRVERDKSMVRITDLKDKMNPVVQNDLILNDLYSPGLKRHIYLLGRFVYPFTKDELKRILESYGNVVHDKMTPEVDLVITGRKPLGEDAVDLEATPEFLAASRWNVEIAAFNKIRDFLRL